MQSTPNCNLYLEDNDKATFREWRKKMNGIEDSNMIIIDSTLGEQAAHSDDVPGVLLAAAWAGAEAPYTQELAVEGLLSTHNGSISLGQAATPNQRKAARDAILSVTGQSDGTLTITADGNKPVVDIPVVTVLIN